MRFMQRSKDSLAKWLSELLKTRHSRRGDFLVEPIFPSAYCFVFSSIYVKDTTTDDGEGVE
ncbi:hypothetical protein O5560_26980, partial [Escherichia coli]|nr:hypothetical protein [Escherichia coli]